METILLVIAVYLLVGIITLTLLDILTKRIRTRLEGASYESQEKLAVSGSPVGRKTALAITVLALWIFWPVAIYGAIGKRGNNES